MKLLDAKQVAEMLETSERTIMEMARKSQIPNAKVGKKRIFTEQAIKIWLGEKEG